MTPQERWHRASQVSGLIASEKAVLLALACHADGDGWCWPAVKTLAEYASCGVRTAQAAVIELARKGVIEAHPRPGRPTRYRCAVEAWTRRPARGAPLADPRNARGGPSVESADPRNARGGSPAAADPRERCGGPPIQAPQPPQELRPRNSCDEPPQLLQRTPAGPADEGILKGEDKEEKTTHTTRETPANVAGVCVSGPPDPVNVAWAYLKRFVETPRAWKLTGQQQWQLRRILKEHGREAFDEVADWVLQSDHDRASWFRKRQEPALIFANFAGNLAMARMESGRSDKRAGATYGPYGDGWHGVPWDVALADDGRLLDVADRATIETIVLPTARLAVAWRDRVSILTEGSATG